MNTKSGERPFTHVLAEKDLEVFRTWKQFKELWKNQTNAEFLIGLLHHGFDLALFREEWIERVVFYLDVADGYLDPRNFGQVERGDDANAFRDPLSKLTGSKVQQAIAIKSWQMLCQYFMKDSRDQFDEYPSWAKVVIQRGVLEKVRWFFRSEKNIIGEFHTRNFDRTGKGFYHETTRSFLSGLIKFAWTFNGRNDFSEAEEREIIKRLNSFKPDLIEIATDLGNLRLFSDQPSSFKLDDLCMARLSVIAMRKEIHVNDEPRPFRQPTSLEEACWGGSEAAQVLLFLQTIQNMGRHLAQVAEARREAREATRRLKELSEVAN